MTINHYLIVGSGNFGAATALHLAKQGCKVTIIETTPGANPRAASHDINKIVRADYRDRLYQDMLVEAMEMWHNDPSYNRFYHEVGVLRADKPSFADGCYKMYEELNIPNPCELLSPDEVRSRWNGAFATADLGTFESILYNREAGFASADKALEEVVAAAKDAGAVWRTGEVDRLHLNPDGVCLGVQLTGDNTPVFADKVLLATGAHTAPLLAKSAPHNKKLHAGERLIATGAVSFVGKLTGELKEKFSPIPVLKRCAEGVKGEGMSILKDGTIKFNCDMCFTNYVTFPPTGEKMSIPPSGDERNTWTGPKFIERFMKQARKTLDGLYGEAVKDVPIDSYRICWDASTPTHDFLITPHPHCPNLYLATGGSFHGWKFLPVIGKYVSKMMHGTLEKEYADRWAWDMVGGDGKKANETYQVEGDLAVWLEEDRKAAEESKTSDSLIQ